jgi:hypothetical protein
MMPTTKVSPTSQTGRTVSPASSPPNPLEPSHITALEVRGPRAPKKTTGDRG